MGRRSSDSEDDSRSRRKRKQRRRSSSSSSSSSSRSRSKVSGRSSRRSARRSRSKDRERDRDRDRDRDRRRRRRSSSSSSHSSSRRRRSRSADRDKGRSHRSHRSRSRERRSHSRHRRSRSSSHGRRRSRSHSRDRSRRREREKQRDKDRDRSKDRTEKKGDPGSIKSKGLEHLTPSEQAKVRMQLVLQAAAKTDEALKAKVAKREEDARKKLIEEGTSLEEQVRRIKDIEAIESDSFVPQAFKSSRDQLKVEVKQEAEITSSENLSIPVSTVYNDTDTLAHPNLFMDKDKAEELWITRLISLRQERLLGSPVT